MIANEVNEEGKIAKAGNVVFRDMVERHAKIYHASKIGKAWIVDFIYGSCE